MKQTVPCLIAITLLSRLGGRDRAGVVVLILGVA